MRRPLRRAVAALAPLLGVASLVVPATSSPASAAVASSALGTFACTGFSGLDNPKILGSAKADIVSFVMADRFKAPGLPARKVGNGHGDITWRQPALGVSGQTWLASLKWLGPLLSATHDNAPGVGPHGHAYTAEQKQAQYARAALVTQDWIRDNPRWEQTDPRSAAQAPVSGAAHRLQFLLCLREKVGGQPWLDTAIARHVKFFVGRTTSPVSDRETFVYKTWKPPARWPRWKGANNIGLDQSLGVLGAACALGRRDWYSVAVRRIDKHAALVYDAQGVDNEQAPGYSAYNFGLWTKTLDRLNSCGGLSQTGVSTRLQKAVEFIAASHRPDGRQEQLGDTEAVSRPIYGTVAEYAATQGASGPVPTQRVGVYNGSIGGYVFGRSGWGVDRPFAQESFYSLRFGKGRIFHGHDDHTSVTYWARGKQVLADGGHPGYAKGAYRDYILSPQAHNVVTATAPFDRLAATKLTSSVQSDAGDAYTVSDTAYAGVTRQRSVLAVLPPQQDVMLVADTLTSATRHRYDQLWHLGPQFAATVAGGRASAVSGDTQVSVVPIVLPGAAAPRVTITRGSTKPLQGWISPEFYVHEKVSTVDVAATGARATILTAVVPAAAGAAVETSAVASPAGGWDVAVSVGGEATVAHLSATGQLSR
ncbi:heparinase II/III-like protein [Motilibacter peucedani]|uniref:Heparinase II/III-like protein n=1 Tax=Motilibacter peucedani TaxID=598650 RepID=A0A420XMF5_9ACTN|nr:heparinase II/III family protein [Motilibacter peucedani]RKS71470.1 heparinase II/III-like protein [Motilibacter peucedani]